MRKVFVLTLIGFVLPDCEKNNAFNNYAEREEKNRFKYV